MFASDSHLFFCKFLILILGPMLGLVINKCVSKSTLYLFYIVVRKY